MATPKRWAVREAADVTFYRLDDAADASYAKGDPVVTLNTLKMTDVETTGETVYARGGRGNAKLVGFSSNREARVTLQDAIFDNAAMAMLTGNEVKTEAKKIQKFEDILLADTTGIGALSFTAEATPEAQVYALQGNVVGALDDAATVVGTVVTSVANAGKRVRVYYTTETPTDTQTITVTSDKFGGTFKVVADVLVRDEETKKDYFGQFIAYNAKIEDSFTFSFSPDGDPSVLDIPLEILKSPESANMWEFVIYGEEE